MDDERRKDIQMQERFSNEVYTRRDAERLAALEDLLAALYELDEPFRRVMLAINKTEDAIDTPRVYSRNGREFHYTIEDEVNEFWNHTLDEWKDLVGKEIGRFE